MVAKRVQQVIKVVFEAFETNEVDFVTGAVEMPKEIDLRDEVVVATVHAKASVDSRILPTRVGDAHPVQAHHRRMCRMRRVAHGCNKLVGCGHVSCAWVSEIEGRPGQWRAIPNT